MSLGLFGAKATSFESSLAVSQVKKQQTFQGERTACPKPPNRDGAQDSFLPALTFHYLLIETTSFTVENEAWRTWAICPGIFAYKFLIVALFLFSTLGWFMFSGTKDKMFSNIQGKGYGLFSAFLKIKNKNSTLNIKTLHRNPGIANPGVAKSMPSQVTPPQFSPPWSWLLSEGVGGWVLEEKRGR